MAAAGTGAQEVMSLVDRWGGGVTDVIGVGGRDLSDGVGGVMAGLALRSLAADPRVEVVLFVSKPPAAGVAERLLRTLGPKPTVAVLIGWEGDTSVPSDVRLARTLDEAAASAVELAGLPRPDPGAGLATAVSVALEGLPEDRTAVRGLFSGGTLCYESMVVLSSRLGPVHSNTPLRDGWDLPAPEGAHVCLDLGEEGVHARPAASDDRPGGAGSRRSDGRGRIPAPQSC